ncbi:hypothetical protein [Achromobacter dolens]|uniref:hypothetical protein n=1 Tax=Achromobacter dolens TaxID=1287738 RepID=UPI00146843C1|nr:hypothetical protein [Achromobacter dolens]CAB3703785.1 hypothetical protein LMG26840_05466 [Achromobacter dolens]
MPIQNTRRVCGPYACDGQITQFPFDFKVFEGEQVAVQVGDALDRARSLTFGADYSVALNDDQDTHPGGTVTLHTAYAQEYRVAIISDVPNTQPDTLINLGGFDPKVIERALDRLEAQVQQVDSIAQRSVRVPIFSNTKPDDLWQELKNDTREAKLAREEAQGWADSALGHARSAASSQQAAEASWSSAAWHSARAWKSQEQATASAAAAQGSADSAAASESAAELHELAASNHEIKVSEDAANALGYANEARVSAAAAKESETAAQGWANQAKASAALADDCIPLSQKGASNGVAGLDDSRRVPELNSRYPGVQTLLNGTDFDTCLTSDDYYIRTAGPNAPDGFPGFGLLRVRTYGELTLQELVRWSNTTHRWWRMRISHDGTWGPWRKVVAEGEAMRRVRLTTATDANTLIEDNVNYAWSNSVVMGVNFPNIRGAGYLLSYHMAGDLFAQELTVLSTGRKPYCFHRFGNPQTNIWQPWRVTGAFSSPNSMPNWDAGDIYVDGIGWHRWNGTRYMAAPGQAEGDAMRRVRLVGTTDANTLIEDNVIYAWSNSSIMGTNFPNIKGDGYLWPVIMAGDLVSQELTVLSTGRKPYCFHRFGNPQTNIWQPWRVTGAFSNANSMPDFDAGDIYVDGIGWHRWNGTRYMAAVAAGALGPGQMLTDVTHSRSLGVVYTNSTEQPIMVYVRVVARGAGIQSFLALQVGTPMDTVAVCRTTPSMATGEYITVSTLVPPGEQYMAVPSGPLVTLDMWKEYR